MGNDFPPTEQDVEVSKLLTSQIKIQIDHYKKLLTEDLEAFNKTFTDLKLDFLTLK